MHQSLSNREAFHVATKAWPLLSAPWINDRVEHVLDRLEGIMDHLIDDGVLASGYFPFEGPMTAKIERQLAEQVGAALEGQETVDDKFLPQV